MYQQSHGEGSYIFNGKTLHHSCFNLEWLSSPKVILDIGAYDFGDSVRFKDKFPTCEIHSFELLKSNHEKHAEFAKNIGIHVNYIAVSDNVGESSFYEGTHVDGVNGQSTLLEPDSKYINNYGHIVTHVKSSCTISTITVGQYCKENNIVDIDLAHIDVEGAEFKVIKGFGNVRPKMVFAEFLLDGGWKNQKSYRETLDLLDSLGYNISGEYAYDKLFTLRE